MVEIRVMLADIVFDAFLPLALGTSTPHELPTYLSLFSVWHALQDILINIDETYRGRSALRASSIHTPVSQSHIYRHTIKRYNVWGGKISKYR